jgi:hypothetical protein
MHGTLPFAWAAQAHKLGMGMAASFAAQRLALLKVSFKAMLARLTVPA